MSDAIHGSPVRSSHQANPAGSNAALTAVVLSGLLVWSGLSDGGDEIQPISRPLRSPPAAQPPGAAVPREPSPAPQVESTVSRVVRVLFQSKRLAELRPPGIQRQLQISSENAAEIDRLHAALSRAMAEIRGRDISRLDATLNEFEPLALEVESRLGSMLSEDQRQWLLAVVISKQRGGAFSFLFPGVRETLVLTDEQHAQIEQIAAGDLEFIRGASVFQLPALLNRSRVNRQRIEALLTPAQRQAWQSLTRGEPVARPATSKQ